MTRHLLASASLLVLALSAPAFAARVDRDFAAGANAEGQDCRAVARFDAVQGVEGVDLYCGAWERPSGFVAAYPASAEAAALARLGDACEGAGQTLASSDFTELRQVACGRDETGPRRFGLIARRGDEVVVGTAYPADWGPMVGAARVLTGAARPEAVARSAQDAPGIAELRAVYPSGAPGQGAAANHELLRRRAYEHNQLWSFSAAERDFSELLRSHEAVAPDDEAGLAEILAEVGLNLSSERRFEEAADVFDRAEARARAADARLMLTKIGNYRAIDALNQGDRARAIELANAANAERDRLFAPPSGVGQARLTAAQARQIETAAAAGRRNRSMVMRLSEMRDSDRAAILSAQADYIAGVAARGLGQRDQAMRSLDRARTRLAQSEVQPGWLVAQIYKERSRLRAAAGDPAGAIAEARTGLALIRRDGPGTRAEGHLLVALADGERLAGDLRNATTHGRMAVDNFARHRESPGMPAEVAAPHLETLLQAWNGEQTPAAAEEYLETLALVWDGAAARSAAQLAARLAASEGGDSVRAYQDAERRYRAALARRERLSSSGDADPNLIQTADSAAADAAAKLDEAEQVLRSKSPRYVELLSPRLKAAELVGALAEDEGYVRLVVADDRVYAALVTRSGVTPYASDLGAAEARELVDRLRKSVQLRRGALPDYDIEAAQILYAKLFAPIGERLAGVSRLQIDAGGPLAGAPFAALVTQAPDAATLERIRSEQNYAGVSWFGRDKAIAVSLGPAAFVRTRANPPPATATAALSFGDFQPNPRLVAERIAADRGLPERCRRELEAVLNRLQALPETRAEAQGAAAAFGGGGRAVLAEAFTDRAVLDDPQVTQAGVLVLATHGVLGLSSCFAEPALLASPGADGDGLIEASELLDLKLSARLVVMSACDTAGGGRSDAARTGFADGGEALSGLARAFIYAGASSVLATHWKIDAATSSLQTQALLTQAVRTGAPVSTALADAQRTMFDNPETAHPFYWSGFVLIGDGGARLSGGSAATAAAAQP